MNTMNAVKTRKSRRKGVTLAELSIVLALIAIVSTMIASFSMMVRAYADRIAGYRNLQESCSSFESMFDIFISVADGIPSKGGVVSLENRFTLAVKKDAKVNVTETEDSKTVTPVFDDATSTGNLDDVLCVYSGETICGWMFLYDGYLYIKFASGTSTCIECEDFSDIRFLLIAESGNHPLVRAMITYEVPSVSEQKETAVYDVLRATRVATRYVKGGV